MQFTGTILPIILATITSITPITAAPTKEVASPPIVDRNATHPGALEPVQILNRGTTKQCSLTGWTDHSNEVIGQGWQSGRINWGFVIACDGANYYSCYAIDGTFCNPKKGGGTTIPGSKTQLGGDISWTLPSDKSCAMDLVGQHREGDSKSEIYEDGIISDLDDSCTVDFSYTFP